MLHDAFYLARKDLRYLFRARETWFWVFLMPIVFFYFIGTVTGGMSGHQAATPRIGFSAPPDAGFLAGRLAHRLQGLGYQVDRVDVGKLGSYERRLSVPAGFTASVLAGRPATVSFRRVGGGLVAQYDEVRVRRAAYTVLGDLMLASKDGQPAGEAAFARIDSLPRTITVEVESAGKNTIIPSGFQQAVPGTLVMFVLLIMFTTGGITVYQERTQGILRRLASAPMSRSAVVAGKWMSRFGLGLVQIAFAMLAGTVLFKVRWGAHLAAVLLVLLAYAALAAAAGMLLGNFGKSEGQVIGLGVILSNVLAAIGGCWWPIEITPSWAQKAALALPTGWAMNALHKLISFGDGPLAVLPHLAAFCLATLAAGYLLARTFRFQ